MARIARRVFAGCPHLVLQHAEPDKIAFRCEDDRVDYLAALRETSAAGDVAVHAYALLERTVLLLVTPRAAADLGAFVQRVNRRYVPAVHRRHGGEGFLWRNRFQSAPLDPEQYLLNALLMVEQSPVRVGLASSPLDWPWSSASHHVGRGGVRWLVEHAEWWRLGNTPFERESVYRKRLEAPLETDTVTRMTEAASTGRPLGSTAFIRLHAEADGVLIPKRPRGRPKSPARVSPEI